MWKSHEKKLVKWQCCFTTEKVYTTKFPLLQNYIIVLLKTYDTKILEYDDIE